MTVQVTHLAKDDHSIVTTNYDTNSWSVDNTGVLTIGDSFGNPDASFNSEFWFKIEKVREDYDEEEDDD